MFNNFKEMMVALALIVGFSIWVTSCTIHTKNYDDTAYKMGAQPVPCECK